MPEGVLGLGLDMAGVGGMGKYQNQVYERMDTKVSAEGHGGYEENGLRIKHS